MTVKAIKKAFWKKNKKNQKNPTTFFNIETDPDLDRKNDISAKKNSPDPDRLPKVNPAEL
jgi:hypothetical protein